MTDRFLPRTLCRWERRQRGNGSDDNSLQKIRTQVGLPHDQFSCAKEDAWRGSRRWALQRDDAALVTMPLFQCPSTPAVWSASILSVYGTCSAPTRIDNSRCHNRSAHQPHVLEPPVKPIALRGVGEFCNGLRAVQQRGDYHGAATGHGRAQ